MTPPQHPWRRRQSSDPTPQGTSRLDLWLQRLTALSQIGLCVLAVVGLFYTVIPLYKAALLEEEIARKTRQLQATENSLRETYRHLREQRVRLYLFNLEVKCNGYISLPKSDLPRKPLLEDPILVTSLTICAKQYGSEGLEDLSVDDRRFLLVEVARASEEMDPLRLKTIDDMKRVPSFAATNPASLASLNPLVQRFLDALRQMQPERVARMELDQRIEETQMQLLTHYRDAVRDRLVALRKVTWPGDTGKAE